MKTTVAYRCDTVAMKCRTATVARPCATSTYAPTVAHRCTLPHPRARTGARARGNILRAMGTVATVCDGKEGARHLLPFRLKRAGPDGGGRR